MRYSFWSSFALVPLVSCMQVTTDTGSGTSGSASGTGASGSDDGGAGGSNCTLDPASQVVLCGGIGSCPAVTVDPAVFPGCGFRTSGSSTPLDLECLCGDSLCPMGVPTTCAQASQLLQTQNVLGVCEQVAEGRCVEVVAPDAGASVPSSCDRTCQAQCGAAADCVQICGC